METLLICSPINSVEEVSMSHLDLPTCSMFRSMLSKPISGCVWCSSGCCRKSRGLLNRIPAIDRCHRKILNSSAIKKLRVHYRGPWVTQKIRSVLTSSWTLFAPHLRSALKFDGNRTSSLTWKNCHAANTVKHLVRSRNESMIMFGNSIKGPLLDYSAKFFLLLYIKRGAP